MTKIDLNKNTINSRNAAIHFGGWCVVVSSTHTHTHAYKYKHEHIFTLSLLSLTLLLFTFSFCLISIEMSLVSCWVSFAASLSKKSFGDILLLIIGTFVTHCTQYLSPCNFGRSHAVHKRRGWSRVPFFESAYICWYFGEWTMIKWHPLGDVHSNVIAKMCAQICVCLSVWEGIRVEAREKCTNKWTNPKFLFDFIHFHEMSILAKCNFNGFTKLSRSIFRFALDSVHTHYNAIF